MEAYMKQALRLMDWVPGLNILPQPIINNPYWPNPFFLKMHGDYRHYPNRLFLVRPPPPLPPPVDTHPIRQPILRQWPSSEFFQKISIQDYRTDNFMRSTKKPDADPETGWVLGLPHRQWRPLLYRDIKKRRANFYGHFDYPSNGGFMDRQLKAKINKKGYPYLGLNPIKPYPKVRNVHPQAFHGGFRPPPSPTFDFHYDTFPEDGLDQFRHDVQFSPPIVPSIADSESPLSIFQDEDQTKCGKINQLVMYLDQKLDYFRDVAPWHRIQVGVPSLRIMQAIYTLFYLTVIRNHCEGNKNGPCNFMRSKDWRNIVPFFLIYFFIALPMYPFMALPWIFRYFNTCRSFNAVLFVIQTMAMAQLTTAIYMHQPPKTQKVIFEYHIGLILVSIFFITYFRVKYDRQLDNMPYWAMFTGCKENKEQYWISTYYGRSDTRGFLTYSSLIRQYHDIFEQAKMNDKVWMRNRAILNNGIAIYFILSCGLFPTLCTVSVWLKEYLGFVMWNFALGFGMSIYQLWYMHHLLIRHRLTDYHWGDIFTFAMVT